MMSDDLELDSSKDERNKKTERGDEASDERKSYQSETDKNNFAENETDENKNDEDTKDKRDEEDEMERFEYEVEEAVAQFVDEKSIPQNTIPDSSDEEDEEELVFRNRRIRRGKDEKLTLGRAFYTTVEFKEMVLDYALRTGNNIVQDRWEKTKIGFKCGMKGKCQWRIYCSYDEPKKMFVVKTIYPNHSCTPNGKCKILKSPIIGRLFMDKLRRNEDFMPLDIQEHIKEQWRFVSSRNQCQRGRGLALKLLEKEYDEQFAHLRGYAQELITSNKDSTVIVETTRGPKGEDVCARFYVCFDILQRTWKGSFRPIIGLDGTFLKAAVKSVLLSTVGHDSNNQIYPIAWAVVQSKNADNWLWYIKQIKTNLVLGDGTGFVILSDRSKGLFHAVKSELPNVEHRMCVKHIIENLKKGHAKKDLLKPLVWNLAWSYDPTDYEENIQKLREYNMSLYEDVMKEQPKSWCRAFYRLGSFCEDVDNNATESFNSTITKARTKAMVPMLETIRRQVMQHIMKRKKKANNHLGKISLYASKVLALEKEDAE